MSKSYLYLENNDLFEKEWTSYSIAVSDGENGMDYLNRRFGNHLVLHDLDARWDGTSWTGFMAIGWWLRRYADGSADACWKGLSDMMKSYDKKWFKTLQSADLSIPDPTHVEPVLLEKCNCQGKAYIDISSEELHVYGTASSAKSMSFIAPNPEIEYLFVDYSCIQNGRAKLSALYEGGNNLHENDESEWWIETDRMNTSLLGYGSNIFGYSDPRKSTPFIKLLGQTEVTPIGCFGDWLLVYGYKSNDLQVQAWVKGEDLCPNPYTTCP